MTHLDISNTSYGQKKGRESNWQFDSLPLKVKNRPNFLASRWCATYHSKVFDEGYNFALDFISIGGLHKKLWVFKVAKVLIVIILGWHLGVGPVAEHRVYYKEEDGGFPQVRAMVSLMSLWLLVARPCTKMLQLCINQLVVWFVQVRVSKWIACQFF
jgi:hypothetical protein